METGRNRWLDELILSLLRTKYVFVTGLTIYATTNICAKSFISVDNAREFVKMVGGNIGGPSKSSGVNPKVHIHTIGVDLVYCYLVISFNNNKERF